MTQQTENQTQSTDQQLNAALAEREQLFATAVREENRILRESLALLQDYVDPSEAYQHNGELWEPLGGNQQSHRTGFVNERELADARERCRALALTNEFAINGLENRVSYIIGPGHQYRIAPLTNFRTTGATGSLLPVPGEVHNPHQTPLTMSTNGGSLPVPGEPTNSQTEAVISAAQEVIDEFLDLNTWRRRQAETQRRMDRDGEAFLWFFADDDGRTRVRFIDPERIATPDHLRTDAGVSSDEDGSVSFGIVTDPDDVETVHAYWVDGERIPASEIQHRKCQADANVRRGVPLFYPVLRTLRWADNLLRNMAAVSDIQTAIALIRKHQANGSSPLENLRRSSATFTTDHPTTGRAYFQQFQPGTILDVYANTEYDFPARGLDASRYVQVLQAILRAVASRLVMPEFMLTSDASNANYSSTLVAEGPAVKMFERLQHDLMDDDRAVMRRVLRNAAAVGRLPEDILQRVRVQIDPPRIATRNRLDEVRADAILVRAGAITPEEMAARDGGGA